MKLIIDWDESSEDIAKAIRDSLTNMMGVNADPLDVNRFNVGNDQYSCDPSALRDMAEAFESAADRLEDPSTQLPTAAYLIEEYGEIRCSVVFPNKNEAETFIDQRPEREVLEVVRKQDAEQALDDVGEIEYQRGFNDGVESGKESERERIQNLIDQKQSGLMGDTWTKDAVDDLLDELREEVEQEDG